MIVKEDAMHMRVKSFQCLKIDLDNSNNYSKPLKGISLLCFYPLLLLETATIVLNPQFTCVAIIYT